MTTNLFNLEGKSALVIGASSGIGENFAKCLAKAGAKVIVSARRKERLEALQQELNRITEAQALSVDISDQASVSELMQQIERSGWQIDILVNSAGLNIRKPLLEYTFQEWRTVMQVNLDGAWLISQAVARYMIDRNIRGSMIHVSSILDQRTFIGSSQAYHASKAGVHQLTKSLALELAQYNIRVNCIAPGWFVTDLNRALLDSPKGQMLLNTIPLKRTGELPELDGALLLLASDASSFMTGSVIRVDGGYATDHLVA